MNSKAQGLSLNTMVIGGIVLVVLLVLIALFTGFFSKFTPEFKASLEKSCEGEGYLMKASCDSSSEKQVVGRFNPPLDEGQVCCRNFLDKCAEGGISDRFCATEKGCTDVGYTVIRTTTCELESEICCKFK